jgi:hypothetical protein
MRLRLSSRNSVNSGVTFQAGTTAPVALVWSTHSTNRSNGNSSSKPIPFRGDATVTIQRATATARGRTAAQDIRRMLSLGQPPALAAAPMRSPALPTVAPYDDSRADADSPAVRSLPTRGPHLASRTAHADVARSKALLPQPTRTVANLLGTHTAWPTGFAGSTVCVGMASVMAVALHGASGPSA